MTSLVWTWRLTSNMKAAQKRSWHLVDICREVLESFLSCPSMGLEGLRGTDCKFSGCDDEHSVVCMNGYLRARVSDPKEGKFAWGASSMFERKNKLLGLSFGY